MATTPYPFDPTGTLASNKITGEQQILTGVNFKDAYFIVPKSGPYFSETLVVNFKATSGETRKLVEGKDYYCTHWFISASRATAKPLYGSISFITTSLSGVVTLTYQTIGGVWTLDAPAIAEILANRIQNPRIVSWDVIANLPAAFPVIDHEWDLQDLVGQKQLVAAISGIETALRTTGTTALPNHLVDYQNPHQTNKQQIGLGNVQNYGIATATDATNAVSNEVYMTPSTTMVLTNVKAVVPLAAHVGSRGNPHGVTADQVGAYTKAQIDASLQLKLGSTQVAYDSSRFDNKTPGEFRDYVLQGTATNAISFSGRTYLQVVADITSRQSADSARLEGLTLQGVKDAVATSGLGNAQKFNGYTYADAKADILSGSIANAERVYSMTQAQLTTAILSGTAANATKFVNKTLAELTDYMRTAIGGWEKMTVEQSALPLNESATGSTYRWMQLAVIPRPSTNAIAAKLSNAMWLVSGGSPMTNANPETEHQDSVYLVRCPITKAAGAGVSTISAAVQATCLSEADAGVRFGVSGNSAGSLIVWARLPAIHRGLTVTQLTRGLDLLTGIDTAAVEQDTAPVDFLLDTGVSRMARVADVEKLRTDMNSAFAIVNQNIAALQ